MEAELLFITAYIIAQRFRFVNSFFEKIRKNLKWLFSFQSLLLLFSLRHLPLYAKYTKTPTTKRGKILNGILFTKKFDEKSYKMDIYKTRAVVYNISPE